MGTYTTNYNLFLPTIGEQGWGDLVNGNFETIDNTMSGLNTRMGTLETETNAVAQRVGTLEGKVSTGGSISPSRIDADSINGGIYPTHIYVPFKNTGVVCVMDIDKTLSISNKKYNEVQNQTFTLGSITIDNGVFAPTNDITVNLAVNKITAAYIETTLNVKDEGGNIVYNKTFNGYATSFTHVLTVETGKTYSFEIVFGWCNNLAGDITISVDATAKYYV